MMFQMGSFHAFLISATGISVPLSLIFSESPLVIPIICASSPMISVNSVTSFPSTSTIQRLLLSEYRFLLRSPSIPERSSSAPI